MRSTIFVSVSLLIRLLFLAATICSTAQVRPAPQSYLITTLGALGGTVSDAGSAINSRGMAVGGADLSGDTVEHATLWINGTLIDLGTLGGPNSGSAAINQGGEVVGVAQTSTIDPLGEQWGSLLTCTATGGPCQAPNLVLGFEWQGGKMKPLATLGGNNGFALAVNNRGQIAGVAEKGVAGKDCVPPQILEFEAVIWGPQMGSIRELPPLPGDSIGVPFGINDAGQAVGGSGPCGLSVASLVHATLWQGNSVIDLGSFGGEVANFANAIDNQGQIVGESDLPGDATGHAFLWQNGELTDLGTLPGDFFSAANAINDEGQVVGESCDVAGNCRAFFWQDGVMTDLNTLVSANSVYLLAAKGISSKGEIAGQAFDPASGNVIGFVATPSRATLTRSGQPHQRIILPVQVRWQLRQSRGVGPLGSSH